MMSIIIIIIGFLIVYFNGISLQIFESQISLDLGKLDFKILKSLIYSETIKSQLIKRFQCNCVYRDDMLIFSAWRQNLRDCFRDFKLCFWYFKLHKAFISEIKAVYSKA